MNLPKTAPAETGSEMLHKLLMAHQKFIYCVALGVVKDPIEAEDLAQQACANMWHRRRHFRYRGDKSFKAWAKTAIKNTNVDRRRKELGEGTSRQPMQLFDPTDESVIIRNPMRLPSEEVERLEELSAIMLAIKELTPRQNTSFSLHFLAGKTLIEIASVMGISDGAVKAHLNRAKTNIRKQLRKHGLL